MTVSNTSGAEYDRARLQLVAGNVNVIPLMGAESGVKTIAGVTSDTYNARSVSQENYFEYRLYTLKEPKTILDRQTKQVALLVARGVPIHRTLEVRGSPAYYQQSEPDLGEDAPVAVYVTFQNRGGSLGIPLPAGVVRLYRTDARGSSSSWVPIGSITRRRIKPYA